MKYLPQAWDTIAEHAGTKVLLVFFDFDGTLAPIVSKPGYARLSHTTRDLLARVSALRSCKLAVVSGRALEDVEQKVGLTRVVYVGNHGLQIKGPGVSHSVALSDRYVRTLRVLRSCIAAAVKDHKGVLVEDKGLTLSVHYRRASPRSTIVVRNTVHALVRPYSARGVIKVRYGKKVVEIRPAVDWDKGSAVRWLIKRWHTMNKGAAAIPLYCGDDLTDEDAFRALAGKGITVIVGARHGSAARYYLKSQNEVDDLLKHIISRGR